MSYYSDNGIICTYIQNEEQKIKTSQICVTCLLINDYPTIQSHWGAMCNFFKCYFYVQNKYVLSY